jgi:hypothetical protein
MAFSEKRENSSSGDSGGVLERSIIEQLEL